MTYLYEMICFQTYYPLPPAVRNIILKIALPGKWFDNRS